MKYKKYFLPAGIAIVLISVAGYFLLGSSRHKKTTYQISDWMVAGVTNPNTGDGALGWARMVVYADSIQYVEDTASNGDISKKKGIVSDTFYVLQTPDFQCPVKDSAGKQMNNPQTHQPVYYLSWRNAVPITKGQLLPLYRYPQNIITQMLANQPKPDTSYKAPNMQVVVKDTAKHK